MIGNGAMEGGSGGSGELFDTASAAEIDWRPMNKSGQGYLRDQL